MTSESRRGAERVTLSEPLSGSIGDSAAKICEISTIGCRVEHASRLAIGVVTKLKFVWSDTLVAIAGRVVWSELRFAAHGRYYVSGIEFREPDGEAAQLVRSLLARHLDAELGESLPAREGATPLFEPAPFLTSGGEIEIASAEPSARGATGSAPLFVECRLVDGVWARRKVGASLQPRDGFTIPMPDNDAEIGEYCRTYEAADDDVRRMMRASLQLRVASSQR